MFVPSFLILMILLFPLSRIIVGKTVYHSNYSTFIHCCSTFCSRVIESSLKEVDKGVIELSLSMGATVPQIIFKVLIPEAMPSLILGITLTIINIIGYSAMAGAIGGGGLGDLAIRYGLYGFKTNIMITSVVVIILLVQGIQFLGNRLAVMINKK